MYIHCTLTCPPLTGESSGGRTCLSQTHCGTPTNRLWAMTELVFSDWISYVIENRNKNRLLTAISIRWIGMTSFTRVGWSLRSFCCMEAQSYAGDQHVPYVTISGYIRHIVLTNQKRHLTTSTSPTDGMWGFSAGRLCKRLRQDNPILYWIQEVEVANFALQPMAIFP